MNTNHKRDVLKINGGVRFIIVDQPVGQPGFVSAINGTVTRFGMAADAGSHGFLAHSYAGGKAFSLLALDDLIEYIPAVGRSVEYKVVEIAKVQAVRPKSQHSDFLDLADGRRFTSGQMFDRIYGGPHKLVLQTCIEKGNIDSWGRLFIIASPE